MRYLLFLVAFALVGILAVKLSKSAIPHPKISQATPNPLPDGCKLLTDTICQLPDGSEPSPLSKRPPIESITYISPEGNPHQFIVGRGGVTFIGETEENGEYCSIPWVEVWDGEHIVARFNQHKLEHILYRRTL